MYAPQAHAQPQVYLLLQLACACVCLHAIATSNFRSHLHISHCVSYHHRCRECTVITAALLHLLQSPVGVHGAMMVACLIVQTCKAYAAGDVSGLVVTSDGGDSGACPLTPLAQALLRQHVHLCPVWFGPGILPDVHLLSNAEVSRTVHCMI